MSQAGRVAARFITLFILSVILGACGGSPWRFEPGPAQTPTGIVATPGDGLVTLNWAAADNAANYTVYYSDSPGVTAQAPNKVIAGTATSVQITSLNGTALANGTRYYFVVSNANSEGESAVSAEVSAVPGAPGPFAQADLEGAWHFHALVSGPAAKWMRGALSVDASGVVSVTSFLDSAAGSSAPAELFSTMNLQADGSVSQSGAAASFHGVLSGNTHRDLLVGTATVAGSSRMLVILQKVVPGISFSASDIQGTGRAGAGPLSMVYHQLTSGPVSEWENASLEVGRDQQITYLALNASTPHPLPGAGGKVTGLSISADGLISETANAAVLPQPAVLLSQAVMSADKMTIVGTATDSRGAYLLRVIQLVHPPATALTSSNYLQASLAGSYGYHSLLGGPNPVFSHGALVVGALGDATLGSFLDSSGSTAPPATITLALDSQGGLTAAGNASYHGEFSYFEDLMVATWTDSSGAPAMSLALRRGN